MFFFQSILLLANFLQTFSQSIEYVYAYSWTPGFCYEQSYPGCLTPELYWTTNLTIHGLWAQYTTTGYPSYCTNEPFDPATPELIGMNTMIQYWPDVQYSISDPSYNSFWEHEWSKHGTCTGLSQYDYFNNAIQLTFNIPTPELLYNSIGHNISGTILRNSFGGNDFVALQCSNQHLTGIYTCWSQTNGIPMSQIPCPSSVINEDTCRKNDQIIVLAL